MKTIHVRHLPTYGAAIVVRSDCWFEIRFKWPDGSRARITGPDGCGLSYAACEEMLDEHERRANAKLTPLGANHDR